MTRRTAIRITTFALTVVAVVCAWAVLAPPELGGSTRYVILEGTSMEPSLHAGDLALVRARETVGKGDVVLYEHPKLGAHVLHRIVRESDGRFTLKGDDNDFLDGVRPSNDEVLGKLWVAVPSLGSAIAWSRQPFHAALIVFVLAFVALGGVAAISAARARSPGYRISSAPTPRQRPPTSSAGASQVALGIGLGALVIFGFLAFTSISRPATQAHEVSDAYAHVATFSYGAEVDESDVYPDGLVDTGEAAFHQLVPELDVALDYRLEAKEAAGVSGSAQLTAVLADGTGWSRSFPVGEPTEFEGATAQVSGILDLAELVRVVDEMKSLTGSGTSTFAVEITADVDVRGRVGGEPTSQSFTPTLALTLDTVSLRPEASGDEAAQFTVRRSEALVSRAPASLSIGGIRLSITDARRLSVLGLILAGLVAAFAGAATWRERTGGEPSQIASLFGDRLITLSRPPSADEGRVTELTDLMSLLRIAEHYDRVVLHWRDGHGHAYQVDDGLITYRYRVGIGIERDRPSGPDEDSDTLVLAPTQVTPQAAAS